MSKKFRDRNTSRFLFGANWKNFLKVLNETRIIEAEKSLCKMLNVDQLDSKTFLDIGSGSGLFSLAARRLGANVVSFDYDLHSVECTKELRKRYFTDDANWIIKNGDVLDSDYMQNLGSFDIVYSWGVLHHTGAMWLGIENAMGNVERGGQFFIAIYNDQGFKSHLWWLVKWIYNKLPSPLNGLFAYSLGIIAFLTALIRHTIKLQPMTVISKALNYKKKRGMSLSHDLIDWIGGFPYEFVRYELLIDYMKLRGFNFERGNKTNRLGCHEFVFRKVSD